MGQAFLPRKTLSWHLNSVFSSLRSSLTSRHHERLIFSHTLSILFSYLIYPSAVSLYLDYLLTSKLRGTSMQS